MQIRLRNIPVHPSLRGYVDRIFVFETDGRVPEGDLRTIVPNGLSKLVIPIRNGLLGSRPGFSRLSLPFEPCLIGVADVPFEVAAEEDAPSVTVTVEFSPLGSYRFFPLRQSEITNSIISLEDAAGRRAKQLRNRICDSNDPAVIIREVESFLLGELGQSREDTIFDYCVRRIGETSGKITVAGLEKETGYSSRWLHMKFDERLGISPKTLCAVTRFQSVFQVLSNNPDALLRDRQYYHIYYDQSHFIREFKRFTGFSPRKFEQQVTDYPKIFYRG